MKIVTKQFGHKSFSLSWNMLNNQGSKVLHCYCCQSIKTRCYSAEKKKIYAGLCCLTNSWPDMHKYLNLLTLLEIDNTNFY